jgi:uncharacterized protein (DUF1501 family)
MAPLSRRSFLEAALFAGATSVVSARLALASAPTEARFVFVLLRGALDGLSAVPPVGDPGYAALRGQIAVARAGEGAARPLPGAHGGLFALHPALEFLHECYGSGECALLHAVATPYRERSHFDAQNVLEGGEPRPGAKDGWINRALAALPGARRAEAGVALGANVPLAMRGPAEVASWSPTKIAALDDETLARITDLYAHDPLLSRRLADALESDAIAMAAQQAAAAGAQAPDEAAPLMAAADEARQRRNYLARYAETARAAAGFLQRDDGPRVAMFDTSGWDTHANQGGAQGQLATRLGALDRALRALKDSLGPVWRHTAVLVATEFGRTAAINGTRGTDHGTGAAAFLLGGAVAGGRMIADWPGLARANLLEGRDLEPTRDLRSVMKGVLRDHLGVPRAALDTKVFPGSAEVRPLDGLVK